MTDDEERKHLGLVAEARFVDFLMPHESVLLPEVLPHKRYREAWEAVGQAVVRAKEIIEGGNP